MPLQSVSEQSYKVKARTLGSSLAKAEMLRKTKKSNFLA